MFGRPHHHVVLFFSLLAILIVLLVLIFYWAFERNLNELPQNARDEGEGTDQLNARAEKGDGAAQYSLAVRYHEGVGAPKDFIEAYKWANLALARETAGAKKLMADLEGKMTSEQIAEGQRLSREFTPR
jgi:TPR repeat protein